MLLFTSAKLTGLVFLVVPLVVFPIIIFGRKVRKLSRESQDRIADVGSFVDEALGAIRTVQAYGHEDAERRNFAGRVEDAFNVAIQRVRTRAALTVIVIVLVFTAIGTILWVGGHDVLAGRIERRRSQRFRVLCRCRGGFGRRHQRSCRRSSAGGGGD